MARPINTKLESRSKKEMEELKTNLYEAFRRLYRTSKDFRNAMDGPLPMAPEYKHFQTFRDGPLSMHPLDEFLYIWERKNTFHKNREFTRLVNLCKTLNSEYDTYVYLYKYPDKENPKRTMLVLGHSSPRNRITSIFKAKGKLIEREEANSKQRGGRFSNIEGFDEIKINDLNSPFSKTKNDLTEALAGMSRFNPTIVQYTNREGNRKLLVSIPEYLDVTTFLKEDGKLLSKLHGEFYQKGFRGRPESKERSAVAILKILENEFKGYRKEGKTLSLNSLAKVASGRLQEKGMKGSSFENIRRNFIETLKQFRDAKNKG
jgi:hypothetical protein